MHLDLDFVKAALTRFQPLGGQGMIVLVLAPERAAEGFQIRESIYCPRLR